jgi:HEAT repeat protein
LEINEYLKLINSRNPSTRLCTLLDEVVDRKLMLTAARACLTDPHDAVRDIAAEVLGTYGSNRDGYRLLLASHDKNWSVRSTVVESLASLNIVRSKDRVREMMISDPHRVVRRDAAWALYPLDQDAVTTITAALKNEEDGMVRVAMYAELYLLGDDNALQSMLDYAESTDFLVRDNVVNGLQYMTFRPEHVGFLKEFLTELIAKEEHPGVRGDAEITLKLLIPAP